MSDATPPGEPTNEQIEAFLIEGLARHLKLDRAEIDAERPFTEYGADSLILVTLGGELETWLARELSPALLWRYPTIRQLATHLAEVGDDLGAMSDEELRALAGGDGDDT